MMYHGYFRSSSSYRLRIAFALKGITPDFRSVHLVHNGGEQRSEAYVSLNPQALVPTLEVDGETLTQSPAILEWLEETHPEPPLLPKKATLRAHVRAFCAAIACEIHPLQNLRVLQFIEANYAQDAQGKEAWCQRWIGDGLAACEALLARQPRSEFCFGNTPGMAEVYLIPQVFSAQRFNVDLSQMPNVTRIANTCNAIPVFADAHPSKQPDAT